MDSGDADALGGGDLFGDRLFTAMDKRDPVAGSLLVASPDMADPNFGRAIIYLIDHDPGGSLGVVLTRPSEMSVGEVIPLWAGMAAPPGVFYIGGPVKPDTGIALCVARPEAPTETLDCLQRVDGRVHLVDLDGDPDELEPHIEGLRVFVGYTGWGPGQLQDELDRGDWYVAPSLPSDVVAPARVDVWRTVLARQDMPLPLYSTFVPDGTVN